ncbi:MAG: acetate kinase, partial [Erysipelotrichaceae bacterium]|nr:acetate kinase [Erysipelotrichaceae bacterium]
MAKIIAVNAGSSSLKFQLFELSDESVVASGIVERIGLEEGIYTLKYNGEKFVVNKPIPNHGVGVQILLDSLIEKGIVKELSEIVGVGHRVVQGGPYFSESAVVDDYVISKVDELKELAPLHNPAHLTGYYAFKEAVPNAGAVMVFDTAFHQTIEPKYYIYPVPYEYYTKYKVRKYGAHGTSHLYVSQRTIDLLGNPEHSNVIVCHLGAGGSLTAVKDGKSFNTSMGLTPLAGIMMGTRSGELDPSVVDFMVNNIGLPASQISSTLNKQSGLLGVSGVSSDFRDVEAGANEGNERCQLALDIYYQKVADFIAQYYVALGHVDAIAFTAGIGENSALARGKILELVAEATGIVVDEEANK